MLRSKPLIALLEPEARNGALSESEIRTTLSDAWVSNFGLEGEMASLGYATLPAGADIFNALFSQEPVEWNRLSVRIVIPTVVFSQAALVLQLVFAL